MSEIIEKSASKIREILSEDGSPYLSAGRVGLFTCLIFSMAFAIIGLKFSANDKVLSYSSLISLQFLGTAVLFYGSTKTSEAFKAKWTPDPVAVDSKISAVVTKVVSVVNAKQEAAQQEAAPEKPEFEEVK